MLGPGQIEAVGEGQGATRPAERTVHKEVREKVCEGEGGARVLGGGEKGGDWAGEAEGARQRGEARATQGLQAGGAVVGELQVH